jgi:hypothetical protein
LRAFVYEFLIQVEVLPWTAVAAGVVLVTPDKAFSYVKSGLKIEDWTS